jgi:hypothetical protein
MENVFNSHGMHQVASHVAQLPDLSSLYGDDSDTRTAGSQTQYKPSLWSSGAVTFPYPLPSWERPIEERNTALVKAVEDEDLQLVRLLLKHGASPNAVGPCPCGSEGHFDTVLHTVARKGNAEILQALLSLGADVNMGNYQNSTALTLVAEMGHVTCLEILLRVDGIEVNAVDNDGASALFCAVFGGNMETTRRLLARGDVDRELRELFVGNS